MTGFSIQSVINTAVQRKEDKVKKSWWPTDLGKCLSGAYYRRLGVKPDRTFDDRTMRVFSVGKLFEDWVVARLAEQMPPGSFETQVRIDMPEYDLTGYGDLEFPGILYEIKTVHSDKFWWMNKKNEGPDRHYLMQLYAGMLARKKDEGRLIYLSKDDLSIAEFNVSIDNIALRDAVFADLEALNKAWRDQIPPPCAETFVNGKLNWLATYCDFHSHCTGDPDWLAKAKAKVGKTEKRIALI